METGVGGKAHGGAADADDNGEEEAGGEGGIHTYAIFSCNKWMERHLKRGAAEPAMPGTSS